MSRPERAAKGIEAPGATPLQQALEKHLESPVEKADAEVEQPAAVSGPSGSPVTSTEVSTADFHLAPGVAEGAAAAAPVAPVEDPTDRRRSDVQHFIIREAPQQPPGPPVRLDVEGIKKALSVKDVPTPPGGHQ